VVKKSPLLQKSRNYVTTWITPLRWSNHVRRKADWFEERKTRTNDGSPKGKEGRYPDAYAQESDVAEEGNDLTEDHAPQGNTPRRSSKERNRKEGDAAQEQPQEVDS